MSECGDAAGEGVCVGGEVCSSPGTTVQLDTDGVGVTVWVDGREWFRWRIGVP